MTEKRIQSHEHEHHHDHDARSWQAIRTEALEAVLAHKGVIDPRRVDAIVARYENEIGPRSGAAVVAKAWMTPTSRRDFCPTASRPAPNWAWGGLRPNT